MCFTSGNVRHAHNIPRYLSCFSLIPGHKYFAFYVIFLFLMIDIDRAGRPGFDPNVGGLVIFLHSRVSRLVLGSTEPLVKLVPGISGGKNDRA